MGSPLTLAAEGARLPAALPPPPIDAEWSLEATTGLTNYHTVLRLLKVETQVVDGLKYKVIFETAPSNCAIADGPYSSELCKPTTNQASAACTAIIYERPWDNYMELTSFRCHK
ncbi:hypothetical protein MRX96_014667 [Rhipicephalus microplus]